MSEEKKNCTNCSGIGRKSETYTETEQDIGMSLAMGAGLGTGYFPMTRTVTKTRLVNCTWCGGTGKR